MTGTKRVATGMGSRLCGRRWSAVVAVCLLGVAGPLWLAEPAAAARPRSGRGEAAPPPASTAWIVMDAATGDVLAEQEPDRPGAPASMTKMMLSLLVMEAIRDGQLKLTDPVLTSALASKMGGSQVYLKEGETFSVEEMMAALLIGSANDAAVALAERLAGTVEGAIARMNERAADLQLAQTRFASVHGLPPGPGQEADVTTPRDMARLSRELLKFPEIPRWTGTQEGPFRQGKFLLQNSNQMVGRIPGVDGLKTGHFQQAGFNVAATAKRGDLRLIVVVMGAPSNQARFDETVRLLKEGFARYVEVTVIKAGAPVDGEVRLPRAKRVFRPVAVKDVRVFVRREERDALRTAVDLKAGVRAPVAKGQPVGSLVVRVGDRELARAPVVAPQDIRRSFFWWLTPWR